MKIKKFKENKKRVKVNLEFTPEEFKTLKKINKTFYKDIVKKRNYDSDDYWDNLYEPEDDFYREWLYGNL